jgi:hypothetical protein
VGFEGTARLSSDNFAARSAWAQITFMRINDYFLVKKVWEKVSVTLG